MHKSPGKLFEHPRKADLQYISQDIRILLHNISDTCEICNEDAIPPFRFIATVLEENIAFNREIAMDIMWLRGKPLIQTVAVETNFQN